MIAIMFIMVSTFFSIDAATPTTKKISSPKVGQLQAEFKQADSKRKKEIITTLTEGGFGHIADTLLISSEQELNSSLKHNIFESERTISQLKQENGDLTAQLSQEKNKHENAFAAQEKKVEALKQEIKTLQEALKASGDQKDKTISSSSKELDEAKQKLAQSEQKIKDLEAEKATILQKNKSLEDRVQSSEKSLKEKQKELEDSQKEMQQFKLEAREHFSKLQADLEECEHSSTEEPTLTKEEQIAELDRKINAFKVQLMADAVEQRKKDYATKTVKGMTFDTAEKMVQSTIKKEIGKLEQQKAALQK